MFIKNKEMIYEKVGNEGELSGGGSTENATESSGALVDSGTDNGSSADSGGQESQGSDSGNTSGEGTKVAIPQLHTQLK